MKRFRGAIVALVVLVVVAVGYTVVNTRFAPEEPVVATPEIFRFEKEDLVGIKVERPDRTIEVVLDDHEWKVVGEAWRPSRSMVRRVAHQIHDLTARATVAEQVSDPSVYGLGPDAITVTLALKDGSNIRFQAGDPNPTSVSWYIRPLPGDTVYVVKKAAVDYYRLSMEEFRERRFAWLDADEADRIEATVDGRTLVFQRVGTPDPAEPRPRLPWRMTSPVEMDAALEEVRTMLGRTGALKAEQFVEDQPQDLTKYGLEPAEHRVVIGIDTGETITLRVGHALPDTDPPLRYVFREEDNVVYTAKDGFLEAFRLPLEKYRKRDVLGKHEWDVREMDVRFGEQALTIAKTSDDWRWPDGAPIAGSTPKRVAGAAAELTAVAFHDTPPRDAGLEPPFATVTLQFEDGRRTVTVGREIDAPAGEEPKKRRYVRVDGDPVVYEVEALIGEVIEDLFREYRRKVERDAEKRIDAAAAVADDPVEPPEPPPLAPEPHAEPKREPK